MKKSRHSESEMVRAVKQLESGIRADVVSREHGRQPGSPFARVGG